MSDSVWLHRRQPTRLPRPWDSPGKNTGVGCHFLLQCMKVKSESEVTQSCPTLSSPVNCSLPGSSVHGIFQARVLEWDEGYRIPELAPARYFVILNKLFNWSPVFLLVNLSICTRYFLDWIRDVFCNLTTKLNSSNQFSKN